jgi:HAE1 family hydrophobic/amphiphilic exporter-1
LAIAGFALSLVLAGFFLSSEFIPQSDRSELYVSFEARAGSSLERSSELAGRLEQTIASHDDVVDYQLLTIGGELTPINEGRVYVKLVDKGDRNQTVFELIDVFREELSKIAGLSISVSTEPGHAGGGNLIQYSIRGPDHSRIKSLASTVEQILKETPGAVDIDNSEKEARPELQVVVDRDLAKDLGLDLAAIGGTVRSGSS